MGSVFKYVEYDNSPSLKAFIKSMIKSQLFKILPMKEENNEFLNEYLDSLFSELLGGLYVFEELTNNVEYIRILNTIRFLKEKECTVKQCKREVFKMINLAKKVYFDVTGELYE